MFSSSQKTEKPSGLVDFEDGVLCISIFGIILNETVRCG
jgi:hypothetical protein